MCQPELGLASNLSDAVFEMFGSRELEDQACAVALIV
jgi:hypothetical protein